MFNVEKYIVYIVFRDVLKSFFDRYVIYYDVNFKIGKDCSFYCCWVDKIGYEVQLGIVFLRFI